jgi:RHS repeat-associated protein
MLAIALTPRRLKRKRHHRRRLASGRRDYNYFRDLEPGTGRYVESDPVGLRGGVSTYGYVRGTPLVRKDPLGLASCGGCDKNDPEVKAMINASQWQMCMFQGAAREGADIVHGQMCELKCTAGVTVVVGLVTRSVLAAAALALPVYGGCNWVCSMSDAAQGPELGANLGKCSKRCEDNCGITW